MKLQMKRTSRFRGILRGVLVVGLGMASAQFCGAQQAAAPAASSAPAAPAQEQAQTEDAGTSTDLFFMLGSDLDRPGWVPAANCNVGIGHTFGFLKKDPFGDEVTLAYTYESGGPNFWHSTIDSDTESLGIMKNFNLPKTKLVTGYTWVQIGLTSYTGGGLVQNRFYDGESIGAIVHLSNHSSIWIQETFNKIVTVPWYLTSSIGYTWSW
jgi:hypothetical protein